MAERTVILVKLHEVTFDEEEAHMTDAEMIDHALHNIAQNVRSDTEYSEFGYRSNFDAVLVCDDDTDHAIKMVMAANELHTRSFGAEEYMVPEERNFVEIDEDRNGDVELDEFAVHDFITEMRGIEPNNELGSFQTMVTAKIKWTDPIANGILLWDKVQIEKRLNDVLEDIGRLDGEWHDIAEYTC